MTKDKYVAGAIGVAAGTAVGFGVDRLLRNDIRKLTDKLDAGMISVAEFVSELSMISEGNPATQSSIQYWTDRWSKRNTDSELSTNFFLNSQVPIVGVNGTDSTPARTMAALIVRQDIRVSPGGY